MCVLVRSLHHGKRGTGTQHCSLAFAYLQVFRKAAEARERLLLVVLLDSMLCFPKTFTVCRARGGLPYAGKAKAGRGRHSQSCARWASEEGGKGKEGDCGDMPREEAEARPVVFALTSLCRRCSLFSAARSPRHRPSWWRRWWRSWRRRRRREASSLKKPNKQARCRLRPNRFARRPLSLFFVPSREIWLQYQNIATFLGRFPRDELMSRRRGRGDPAPLGSEKKATAGGASILSCLHRVALHPSTQPTRMAAAVAGRGYEKVWKTGMDETQRWKVGTRSVLNESCGGWS